jgi:N-acetyltransferase
LSFHTPLLPSPTAFHHDLVAALPRCVLLRLFLVRSSELIWEQHPHNTRYQEEVFKKFFRDALSSGGALIAIDSQTGRVIGSSRYDGYDKEKSQVEIGWTFLARSYWGGVYNGEMKRLMLEHAFKFVHSVIFVIGKQNFRSQKAIEKLGAVQAGSTVDSGGADCFVYRIALITPGSPGSPGTQ